MMMMKMMAVGATHTAAAAPDERTLLILSPPSLFAFVSLWQWFLL